MWSILSSPRIITYSSILSILSSNDNIIDRPLVTMGLSCIFGALVGNAIENIIPPRSHQHVAGGILVVSLIIACARYIGFLPPRKNTPWLYVNIQSGSSANIARISYTAHHILENIGATYEINEPLTVDSVLKVLKDNDSTLDYHINISTDIIHDTLKEIYKLDRFSGIFIHGPESGYVMIKSSNQISTRVVSIRI